MKPFNHTQAIFHVCLLFSMALPAVAGADIACKDAQDCRLKWQRAEKWVRENSHWPIASATDTKIETERQRGRGYSNLYYRITKEKQDGQTVIQFYANCLPSVSCNPDPEQAQESFSRYVSPLND